MEEKTADVTRDIGLPIVGMTCVNCATTIERTLKRTQGVGEASVNFAAERAQVRYDPAVMDMRGLVQPG
jgi:Cu+-exporting ATPase